jgi:hypothetical protein
MTQLKKDRWFNRFNFSLLASAVMHSLLFFIFLFIYSLTFENPIINTDYVEMQLPLSSFDQIEDSQTQSNNENDVKTEKVTQTFDKVAEAYEDAGFYYNFTDINADTTTLDQLYSEQTLKVRVKYPAGWTFIDQNVGEKLDGVTFWALTKEFNPPPYIHLEVKDKYLFSESRFKYRKDYRNFSIYYNDPEELEGQVTQIIYIRTDTDEDYSLKLIMKEREAFKRFQPRFFGMVKSFKFGKSFF